MRLRKYLTLLFIFISVQSIAEMKMNNSKLPFTIYSIGNAESIFNATEKTTEELVFQMIFEQLPEYDVVLEIASFDTAYNHIEASKNICIRNLIKTAERQKSLIFSKPQSFLLSPRLYFSPYVDAQIISKIMHLPFSEIFKHYPSLSIGFESNRAYGTQLQKHFSQLEDANVFTRIDSNGENLMIAMLLKGRFDMLVEYPYVFDYKAKIINPELSVQHTSISDVAPLIFTHIACNKSDDSAKLIKKINAILASLYFQQQYIDSHLKLINQTSHSLFIKLLKQYINNMQNRN